MAQLQKVCSIASTPALSNKMETSATREYPSLIYTLFMTYTVGGVFLDPEDKALYDEMLRLQGLGSNTPTGVPYTEDEIMAIVRGGKQRGHILGVGWVLPGQRTVIPPPSQGMHLADIDRLKTREKLLMKEVNMFKRLFRSDDSEVETSNIMPPLNDHPISRLSKNGDEYKQSHGSVSPRVYLNIKLALQHQEDNDELTKKTSVYGGMEKRSSAIEFKISRKYLRAPKQKQCNPQEECWKTKGNLWSQKSDQSSSPTVKKTISPKSREPMNQATRSTKMAIETMMMAGIHSANHSRIKKSTMNSINESRRSILMKQVQGGAEIETSYEPGSNKRLTSVVVARLMGLESLTDFNSEVGTSKIMPPLNDVLARIRPFSKPRCRSI
nr:protein longifolia 1-like [Tanacetum cinerariifolium]